MLGRLLARQDWRVEIEDDFLEVSSQKGIAAQVTVTVCAAAAAGQSAVPRGACPPRGRPPGLFERRRRRKRNPSIGVLGRIATALGVDIEEFFRRFRAERR